MHKVRVGCWCGMAMIAAGACAGGRAGGAPAAGPEVVEREAAIAQMKQVPAADAPPEAYQAQNKAWDHAWATLKKDAPWTRARLARELKKTPTGSRAGDHFHLDASALLWEIGGLAEADQIGAALQNVDYHPDYSTAFHLFSSSSHTADRRAWPVVHHALRSDEGHETFFAAHFMRVRWPLTLEFTISPLGETVCAFLEQAARPLAAAELRSLVFLAGSNHCGALVATVREALQSPDADTRLAAVRALGMLAFPEDRQRLEEAARKDDPKSRFTAAYALYEFGDPATRDTLLKLLDDDTEQVRTEALAGVLHLVDGDSGVRVCRWAQERSGGRDAELYGRLVEDLARRRDGSLARVQACDPAAWQNVVQAYWAERDHFFDLKPGDRRPTRAELQSALAEWKSTRTIAGGAYEWMEARHVLAVARAEDLDRLRGVRGALLTRHSDEVMYEVQEWDRVIKVVHRRAVGAAKPGG